jgi:ammonium transporter, Amt family
MIFIKYVCRVPLRMTDEDCLIGDDAIHGESAYTFGDDVDISTLHGKSSQDLEAATITPPSGEQTELVDGSKEIKQS